SKSTLCCFFFSSRRRHTRSKRDWSSDVCSSDLRFSISLFCQVHHVCSPRRAEYIESNGLFNCNEQDWCPLAPASLGKADLLPAVDRKSTRLNSSHVSISYAVSGLKQKTSNPQLC